MYLLIKYIKSVFWRVAKRLTYIEDALCLKVKRNFSFLSSFMQSVPVPNLSYIGQETNKLLVEINLCQQVKYASC